MRSARGFTLIELAIVLVVVGTLLAAGMPAYGRYRDDLRLSQARAQLTEDVRMARQLAVTRRAPVYVRFGVPPTTTDITSYTIHVDQDGNGAYTNGERIWRKSMPRDTRLTNVTLGAVDTLAFDISGILIQPTSLATPGGTLVFRNARNRRDTLAVSTAGILYRP